MVSWPRLVRLGVAIAGWLGRLGSGCAGHIASVVGVPTVLVGSHGVAQHVRLLFIELGQGPDEAHNVPDLLR
jgi:hypothetical protein